MEIKTKFNIGDKVFYITKENMNKVIACSVCNDTKQVIIKDEKYRCPRCQNGLYNYFERWFCCRDITTIGQINLSVVLETKHKCNYFDEEKIQGDGFIIEERYMLAATGIGSGTLWEHSFLFASSKEAEVAVLKRNEKLIQEELEQLK